MAELRETHVLKTQRGSKATPWLAFIVGALLIAVIAVFLMNARGRITSPAGTVDFNIDSPVTTAPASREPVNSAPAK